MSTLSLKSDVRKKEEKASYIRQSKKIPAVVYGKNTDAQSIQVEYSDFLRTYRQA